VTVRSSSDVWVFASPFFPGHGGAWDYNGHHWSKVGQLMSSNPSQVIPDGSGGLWIPLPSADGIAF
jgi:hypothetical protein